MAARRRPRARRRPVRVSVPRSAVSAPGSGAHIQRLRLLSFNIQAGISTGRFREYVTRGWRQLLPDEDRPHNLERIAAVVRDYDFVALQEVDAGSLRSGFVNQVAQLAGAGDFPYWYAQRNRRLGPLAQHGNGLLSRLVPSHLEDHPLPSMIPGRGAIFAELDPGDGEPLLVIVVHLSLGAVARERQLAYLRNLIRAERARGRRRVVLMGDMNSPLATLLEESPLGDCGLVSPAAVYQTYPSWAPALALDHVLVTPDLQVRSHRVLPDQLSDHLPVAVELELPA